MLLQGGNTLHSWRPQSVRRPAVRAYADHLHALQVLPEVQSHRAQRQRRIPHAGKLGICHARMFNYGNPCLVSRIGEDFGDATDEPAAIESLVLLSLTSAR